MTSQDRQPFVDSPRLCHYADDPARRPRCTAAATVQLGAIMLCSSCNTARSTLGKGQTPVPLPAGPAFDVLGWVATAHQHVRAPPTPPLPQPSPEPAKPEHHGRPSEPNSASHAKAHNNASRAHRLMS
jgi:hypothetical protein